MLYDIPKFVRGGSRLRKRLSGDHKTAA